MDAENEEADNLLGRDSSIFGVPGFGFGHGERRSWGRGSRNSRIQAMGGTALSRQALGLPELDASQQSDKTVSFHLDTINDDSVDEVDDMETSSTEEKKCSDQEKIEDEFLENGCSFRDQLKSETSTDSVDSNAEYKNFISYLGE